jgi:hypothetical protein
MPPLMRSSVAAAFSLARRSDAEILVEAQHILRPAPNRERLQDAGRNFLSQLRSSDGCRSCEAWWRRWPDRPAMWAA